MARRSTPRWQPKWDDYRRVFQEQNPWHQSGTVPEDWGRKVERPLARLLAQRLRRDQPHRFQLILGPRRVGKTTSMYQCVRHLLGTGVAPKSIWWMRLDHPLLMELSLEALGRYAIQSGGATVETPLYLFLDEVSYSSKWDLWLKTFHDDGWPVRIAASSSSTAALRDRRLESGVGRWEEQYLSPYLFSEYLDLIGRGIRIPVEQTLSRTLVACVDRKIEVEGLAELRKRFMFTGGFPELLIEPRDTKAIDDASSLLQSQRVLRSDAVERAVYKDIPQAFGVDDPLVLERLLYTLAGQITGVLSPASICQGLGGLSQPTFARYSSYLERAFLIFLVPNFAGNEATVQRRGKKLYFVDGAVRNAALQRGLGPLTDHDEMGLLLENMAAAHLFALGRESSTRLYYWRDRNDEIDLIFDHPNDPVGFEIATSSRHHRRGLEAFMNKFPGFEGRCYLVAPDLPARSPGEGSDRIGTLPLDLLLTAVGAQLQTELALRLVGVQTADS